MKTIITKYFGPSAVRGSRIKASTADNRSLTISYPDDASGGVEGAHTVAAQALADLLGWKNKMVCGGMPDNKGFAFVLLPLSPAELACDCGEKAEWHGPRDGLRVFACRACYDAMPGK